jgi:hypothetical protein
MTAPVSGTTAMEHAETKRRATAWLWLIVPAAPLLALEVTVVVSFFQTIDVHLGPYRVRMYGHVTSDPGPRMIKAAADGGPGLGYCAFLVGAGKGFTIYHVLVWYDTRRGPLLAGTPMNDQKDGLAGT